jgi:hypothetical protein
MGVIWNGSGNYPNGQQLQAEVALVATSAAPKIANSRHLATPADIWTPESAFARGLSAVVGHQKT